MAILISDKADFKTRNIVEDKDNYLIIIKLITYQKVIKIINMYVFSNKALKCMNQKTDKTKGIVNKVIHFWRL